MHERVLVKDEQVASETQGGLMIPIAAQDVPTIGKVIKIGPLVNEKETVLLQGDTVMYMKYAGLSVTLDGEQYRILLCNDIILRM